MATKNPRINVIFEKPLYDNIERLAKRDGVSLSLKMRDLVKDALELQEDIALSNFAEKREQTFLEKKPWNMMRLGKEEFSHITMKVGSSSAVEKYIISSAYTSYIP